MAMDDTFLLQFWGKTPREGDAREAYHPAIYHMLDVAFVAEALLSDKAAARPRRALLRAWDGCDLNGLHAWLPFLVATHDLGKISAAFQGQAKEKRTQAQRQRLEDAGISFPPHYEKAPYHAEISAVWIDANLIRNEPATQRRFLWAVRDAMGGHHGRFTQEEMRQIGARLRASERNDARWDTWRDMAYRLLRRALDPPGNLAALGVPRRLRPATAALTGFIILCDWIGSNGDYFPASPRVPLDVYMRIGRERAAAAITRAGLAGTRPKPAYAGFGQLFEDITEPRALQRAIDTLPEEALGAPLLAVIEAPTGEGKTEAALALARRLGAIDGIDEIFFGLPTMATSNQMFRRLSRFYNDLYGAAVRLTHSQSAAVEEELRRAALAGDRDAAAPESASALAAIDWFAGPKKAMLAPFGVGTVDQVELAGLNVRHYMLRLFALAGKVVIVDEVHAYDAYMSVILEHTLAWLASLGTSVILLSATLPAARHRALATSYIRGLDRSAPTPDVPAGLPYPAISLYHAGGQHRAGEIAVFREDQRLTLRLMRSPDPEADARRLIDLVRDGGAVARICNRVDDAQAIYRALRDEIPPDQRVLLHARFPLDERQKHEQRIEAMVGKATARTPDQPLIVVGTQVLEQSLDYDVDVMISDFAPIDLLLQRAGRLHRHVKERAGRRPPRHSRPVLEVVLPLGADDLPIWERWAPIYEPYLLWRTWEVLRANTAGEEREIVLPHDYRPLIEAVYHDGAPPASDGPHAGAMAMAWAKLDRSQGEMRAQARKQLTPACFLNDEITAAADIAFVEDEDGKLAGWQVAKTRLGDRITVVPLYRVGGRLTLDRFGTWPLPDDAPRDLGQQREIIRRSLSISDPRIIAAFRNEDRPRDMRWPWGEIPPLLRSLYPLVLNTSGAAEFDKRTVRLDKELGLVIEKEEL
ncbi:MAG TPA: CRISPR-associated helicase Cas3' [Roseiflexaceae bacterium]|nr:CRISPR-associated helicase Cas3' [Roseiflexaceae bacterium]